MVSTFSTQSRPRTTDASLGVATDQLLHAWRMTTAFMPCTTTALVPCMATAFLPWMATAYVQSGVLYLLVCNGVRHF